MNTVLVIGGTGNIGRHVVSQLVETDVPVRVLTRNPAIAGLPPKAELYQGDLMVPESLDAALDGVQAVFLVWTLPLGAFGPVLERIARHAHRIVFLSAPIKTEHPFFQQPNPLRDMYAQMEQMIETTNLEHTYLRPGMFAGNAINWWAKQIQAGDLVRWPYLDAPTAPIDERDIAAVAVKALCEDRHAGADYVLTGPQSLTQGEQIATIADAIGRQLRIEEMTPEDTRKAWNYAKVADMLLNAWAAAMGQPAYVTDTVAKVTGVPARTFFEWARENKREFEG